MIIRTKSPKKLNFLKIRFRHPVKKTHLKHKHEAHKSGYQHLRYAVFIDNECAGRMLCPQYPSDFQYTRQTTQRYQ